MPAQKNPYNAGFARPRGTNNGNVAPRLNGEINVVEDHVPGCPDAHSLKSDGDASRLLGRTGNRNSARRLGGFSLLASSEWFEQAKRYVPLRRVLPGDDSNLLAKNRQVQRPINQQ